MSSNKTSLGLNQWDSTDKLQRVDFNKDNEIINAQLANKVNVGPPQEYDIPYTNGVTKYKASCYCKNNLRQVTVTLSFQKNQGLTNGLTVAVLPEGFRPKEQIDIPAAYSATTRQIGLLSIAPNGAMNILPNETSNYGYATCTFVAQ